MRKSVACGLWFKCEAPVRAVYTPLGASLTRGVAVRSVGAWVLGFGRSQRQVLKFSAGDFGGAFLNDSAPAEPLSRNVRFLLAVVAEPKPPQRNDRRKKKKKKT